MSVRGAIASHGFPALLLCLTVSCAAPRHEPEVPAAADRIAQGFDVARRAYEQGEFAQARALYRQALMRARAIDDAALAADAAYNVAVSEIALQNYEAADRLLHQAAYDAARASTDIAEPLLLRAKVAYLRGRQHEAISLTNDVIASAAALTLRLQATILRGQIHADSGDLAAASADLESVARLAAASTGGLAPAIAADATKLEGTIALRHGNTTLAAQLFDSESDLLRSAHRYRDMGHALGRAAGAYLRAGNAGLAAERFFLAARSQDGLGDSSAAKAYLASSLAAAAQAADEDTGMRARLLLEEINQRGVP